MAAKRGFSLASVVTSFLMVWGGTVLAIALAAHLEVAGAWVIYGAPAAGGLVAGFLAARASRGSTILEPGIGAALFLGSLVGLALLLPDVPALFRLILNNAEAREMLVGPTLKLAGSGVGGAVAGAFVSEKLLGEASRHGFLWILYTALATFGGTCAAMLAGGILAGRAGGSSDALGGAVIGGMGAACLLAGLAAGAQTRTRALLANALGGGAGIFLFVFLIAVFEAPAEKGNFTIGATVLAVGAAIVTLAGTAIGWAVAGKRAAERE